MRFNLIRASVVGAVAVGAGTAAEAQQQPVDIGKTEYLRSCAVCHGTDGRGNGPLVVWLKKPAADLTQIQKNNVGVFPFDKVYQVIDGREAVEAHGPRDMPVWGDQYSSEALESLREFGTYTPKDFESFVRGRIIALIGYIYSLQQK
jgi:mono/diheme cytochrome c family protein